MQKTDFKTAGTAGIALVASGLLGTAQTAQAQQTIGGAVGLPLNPTAEIPAPGSIHVQGNFYDLGRRPTGSLKLYGIYAAGRAGDRLEINGGLERSDTPPGVPERSGVAIGAKYQIKPPRDANEMRIAVGIGHNRALLKNTHVYAVASKPFGTATANRPATMGHLGVRYDHYNNAVAATNSNITSIYGGVEVPMNNNLAFVGELQSKNTNNTFGSGRFPYSASIRYQPTTNRFHASVGVARQGVVNDNGVFVQIGTTF